MCASIFSIQGLWHWRVRNLYDFGCLVFVDESEMLVEGIAVVQLVEEPVVAGAVPALLLVLPGPGRACGVMVFVDVLVLLVSVSASTPPSSSSSPVRQYQYAQLLRQQQQQNSKSCTVPQVTYKLIRPQRSKTNLLGRGADLHMCISHHTTIVQLITFCNVLYLCCTVSYASIVFVTSCILLCLSCCCFLLLYVFGYLFGTLRTQKKNILFWDS